MKSQSISRYSAGRLNLRSRHNYAVVFGLLIVITYILERVFSATYGFGDGQTYTLAYNALVGLPLSQAYIAFTAGTSAAEPISFLLFFSFSQYVNISTMNFFLNLALIIPLFLILHKRSVNILVWVPFVLTNFYLLMAEYSALRLKIALIFLFLFWLARENKWRWVWTVSMVLGHFQMTVLLMIQFVVRLFSKRQSWLINLIMFLAIALIFTEAQTVIAKIAFYIQGNEYNFPYKMIVLFLVSLVLLERRKYLFAMFVVFFPVALIVGDFRLNIIYFLMIVQEYLAHSQRTPRRKFLLIIMAGYLSAKGLGFALDTFNSVNYFTDHTSFLP